MKFYAPWLDEAVEVLDMEPVNWRAHDLMAQDASVEPNLRPDRTTLNEEE